MIKVKRREIKYVISEYDYYKLDSLLKKILKEDSNNEEFGYTVRSLYFDSIFDSDYYDKMNGDEVRKKIRIRTYNPDAKKVKIEIKRKINLNQSKESMWISREDAEELIDKNYTVLLRYENKLAKTIYNIMSIGAYRPVVLIDYKRKAYLHKENSIRITLDSDITCNETNFDMFSKTISMRPVFDSYNAVLEVKYDGEMFCWVTGILQSEDIVLKSLSKYCSSRQFFENYLA